MRRLIFALLFCSRAAFAYNESIHAFLTRSALPQSGEALQPPGEQDLAAFRALFWRTASASPEFARRYPSAESFDAWAFKEFLMLDPASRVHGFDLMPDDALQATRGQLLVHASRWPDDDERNRHRYLRDPKTHEIVKAADGSPMPFDPATLDFGSLTGTTSQGHAHYGLVDGPLSDDPEVLKKDPARFAVPPTAHAYGAEMAQLYTDLALLAANSGLPSARWLSACFEGAAFHHLQDVSNQIHTVQVGIYEFFQSAFLQSKLRDVRTLGGLLGDRRSLKQIGLRLIANHHLLSEDLFAKRVAEVERGKGSPEVRAAIGDLGAQDAALEKLSAEKTQRAGGQFGLGLARALIAESSVEAPEVYRLAWTYSAPTLRDGVSGHEYDGAKGDDPDDYLDRSPKAQQAMSDFYRIEGRGLRRAATALRIWQRDFDAEYENAAPAILRQRAVERILAVLLPYHAQAAQRRASFQPAPQGRAGIAWGYPVAAAVLLAAGAALIRSRLSKRS